MADCLTVRRRDYFPGAKGASHDNEPDRAAGSGHRHLPDQRNRLRRVLGRERPPVRGVLSALLGLQADRLSRPRDRHPRPLELRPRAGQDPLRAHHRARPRRSGRRPCGPAWRRGPRHRLLGGRRARRVRQGDRARRHAGPGADRARGRPRQGGDRRDPDLRRHHPLDRGAEGIPRDLSARIRPDVQHRSSRPRSACSTWITASATSSSAR